MLIFLTIIGDSLEYGEVISKMGGSLVVLGAFGRFHGGRGTLFCQGFLGGPFVKVKILFIRGTFRINTPHTIQPICLVLKLIAVTM